MPSQYHSTHSRSQGYVLAPGQSAMLLLSRLPQDAAAQGNRPQLPRVSEASRHPSCYPDPGGETLNPTPFLRMAQPMTMNGMWSMVTEGAASNHIGGNPTTPDNAGNVNDRHDGTAKMWTGPRSHPSSRLGDPRLPQRTTV